MGDPSTAQRERWVGILLAVYLLFVVYGSLVPLRHAPRDFDDAVRAFAALRLFDARASRIDFATNVLLFFPLAFLAAQAAAPRAAAPAWMRPLLLLAAVALAGALEFAQLYFPPRTSSLTDVLAESVGAAAGLAAQRLWGARFDDWLGGFWLCPPRDDRVRRLLVVYVAGLFLFSLMPLDLTLSPVEILHKWRAGGIVVVPFTGVRGGYEDLAYEVVTDALVWLPAGVLWALTPQATLRSVLTKGMLWSAALEGLQLFVMSRTTDPTDVLTAVAGVAAGFRIARWRATIAGLGAPARSGLLGALWLGWLLVVLGLFWFPFDFEPARATAHAAWHALTRTPLLTYFYRSEFGGLNEVLRKVLGFLPGGLLLGLMPGGCGLRRHALAISVLIAVLVEGGQLMLPDRTADVTDLGFEWLGGIVGVCAGRWIGR